MKYERLIDGSAILTVANFFAQKSVLQGFRDYNTWGRERKEMVLKTMYAFYLRDKMQFASASPETFFGCTFTKTCELGSTKIEKEVTRNVVQDGVTVTKMKIVSFRYDYLVDIQVDIEAVDLASGIFEMTYTISDFPYLYSAANKERIDNVKLPEMENEKYQGLQEKMETCLTDLEDAMFTTLASKSPVVTAFYKALSYHKIKTYPGSAANRLAILHTNASDIVPAYDEASIEVKQAILDETYQQIKEVLGRNFEHVDIYTYAKYFFYILMNWGMLESIRVRPHFIPEREKLVQLESVICRKKVVHCNWQEVPVALNYYYMIGDYKMKLYFDAHAIWSRFAGGEYKEFEE